VEWEIQTNKIMLRNYACVFGLVTQNSFDLNATKNGLLIHYTSDNFIEKKLETRMEKKIQELLGIPMHASTILRK
tara:strand:+ start:380 stop:604 length:225 start_codon:yes stop_codon:yes gene_type:complete